jgi:CheY-like chemotaxis protein
LHRTYISDVERGARNVSLQSIARLAGALKTSVSALFPEEIQIEKAAAAKIGNQNPKLVEVLLVEDNPDDAELTLHAFKGARFMNQVHVVGDGVAALDFLFCRGEYSARTCLDNPQLVLLDLNLPKVSGLEVLRRIKKDKRTWQIPVAVLTASRDVSEITECRRLGAEQYIIKPVNLQQLSLITPQLDLEWALFRSAGAKSGNKNI